MKLLRQIRITFIVWKGTALSLRESFEIAKEIVMEQDGQL